MVNFVSVTSLVMPNLIERPLPQRITMERQPCVCILASGRHGTIYIGETSDLLARVYQHRVGTIEGFTKQHGVKRLVHFEMFADMENAIAREKQLKGWRRDWKTALIERDNFFWEDLALTLGFEPLAKKTNPSCS